MTKPLTKDGIEFEIGMPLYIYIPQDNLFFNTTIIRKVETKGLLLSRHECDGVVFHAVNKDGGIGGLNVESYFANPENIVEYIVNESQRVIENIELRTRRAIAVVNGIISSESYQP